MSSPQLRQPHIPPVPNTAQKNTCADCEVCTSNSVYSNQCIIDTQGHAGGNKLRDRTRALPRQKKLNTSKEPIALGEVSTQELMDLLARFDYTHETASAETRSRRKQGSSARARRSRQTGRTQPRARGRAQTNGLKDEVKEVAEPDTRGPQWTSSGTGASQLWPRASGEATCTPAEASWLWPQEFAAPPQYDLSSMSIGIKGQLEGSANVQEPDTRQRRKRRTKKRTRRVGSRRKGWPHLGTADAAAAPEPRRQTLMQELFPSSPRPSPAPATAAAGSDDRALSPCIRSPPTPPHTQKEQHGSAAVCVESSPSTQCTCDDYVLTSPSCSSLPAATPSQTRSSMPSPAQHEHNGSETLLGIPSRNPYMFAGEDKTDHNATQAAKGLTCTPTDAQATQHTSAAACVTTSPQTRCDGSHGNALLTSPMITPKTMHYGRSAEHGSQGEDVLDSQESDTFSQCRAEHQGDGGWTRTQLMQLRPWAAEYLTKGRSTQTARQCSQWQPYINHDYSGSTAPLPQREHSCSEAAAAAADDRDVLILREKLAEEWEILQGISNSQWARLDRRDEAR